MEEENGKEGEETRSRQKNYGGKEKKKRKEIKEEKKGGVQ